MAMGNLDLRSRIHILLGTPDTLDSLRTFVEPEGCLSPGSGPNGVHLWPWDERMHRLHAATDGRPLD